MKIKAAVLVTRTDTRVLEIQAQEPGPFFLPAESKVMVSHAYKSKLDRGVWLFRGSVDGLKASGEWVFLGVELVGLLESSAGNQAAE